MWIPYNKTQKFFDNDIKYQLQPLVIIAYCNCAARLPDTEKQAAINSIESNFIRTTESKYDAKRKAAIIKSSLFRENKSLFKNKLVDTYRPPMGISYREEKTKEPNTLQNPKFYFVSSKMIEMKKSQSNPMLYKILCDLYNVVSKHKDNRTSDATLKLCVELFEMKKSTPRQIWSVIDKWQLDNLDVINDYPKTKCGFFKHTIIGRFTPIQSALSSIGKRLENKDCRTYIKIKLQ